MAAKHWQERFLSRIFHLFITTGIVLILLLKDTELKRSAFEGRWFYVSCFLGVVVIGMVFYFVASFIDPGYLEMKNQNSILVSYEKAEAEAESQSEEDENTEETCKILASPPFGSRLRRCGYCALMQPLRAKHCEDCGKCVRRYDHHCPWLGTCVGERNHKFFWCFLLSQNIIISWSLYIIWSALIHKKSWYDWFLSNALYIVAMVVLVAAGIVVFLLFCCHTFLMMTAQTTWEYMSRSRISYLKTLSEDDNPFDQGFFCNIYKFLCSCRVQKWEVLLRQRDRWA
ncbi:hypothetical protein QZH41_015766 [Actinostola sp. cb2023]|nr:hypothetical protein QZH41_015766 [Actinostola sp. cb2023]